MFKRRRFSRKRGSKGYGGVLKFASRYPGRHVTQVPYPQTYFTKHPFYFDDSIIDVVTDYDVVVFEPTALFNVDTIGGDAGYASILNAQYERYVVLGFSYKITIVNKHTSSLLYVVSVHPNSDVPVDDQDAKYRVGAKQIVVAPGGQANATKTQTGYVNCQGLFGVKVWNEKDFFGVFTTDPTRNAFLYSSVATIDATTTFTYDISVHFQIYVKWFDRDVSGEPAALGGGGAIGSLKMPIDRVAHIGKLEGQLKSLKDSLPLAKKRKLMEIELKMDE